MQSHGAVGAEFDLAGGGEGEIAGAGGVGEGDGVRGGEDRWIGAGLVATGEGGVGVKLDLFVGAAGEAVGGTVGGAGGGGVALADPCSLIPVP